MSKPTPPGLTTPSSMSVATTPPTGRPYPWWMSGMASDAFTMPGQRRAVRHLLEGGVLPDGGHQRLVGEDQPRHAHAGSRIRGDAPEIRSDLFDLHGDLEIAA